jgi:2-succinyl-5-enolpyruvyl-6-hydroxy-3-cyclohexene-1-carboxylate synthase
VNVGDVNLAAASALVDTFARAGMRHICLSPGSRSTPLALAAARHPDIAVHVHLDERSSAFVALGIARGTDALVGVVTTSGTAAAELLPAVVEASQSRVALVLITADRPPRLRGTGANQTIDQIELFGRYARRYIEPPVPSSLGDAPAWARAALEAVDAADAADGSPAGPVHVNTPFDEPLVPTPGWEPPKSWAEEPHEPNPGRTGASIRTLDAPASTIPSRLSAVERGVVVAGTSRTPPDVGSLATTRGWPVIADPTSNARGAGDGAHGAALAAGQPLIATASWVETMAPDVVVVVGGAPISRATNRFIASARDVIVVVGEELDPVPERLDAERIELRPRGASVAHHDREVNESGWILPTDWTRSWLEADGAARRALDDVLDAEDAPTGLRTARDVAAAIPGGGLLLIGNSLPVRDLDAAMAPRHGLRVVGNRGASGIDGLLSTAVGLATAGIGPTFALVGDLTFLYDLGSLVWTNAHEPPQLTVVVVNNGRGDIFATLGQETVPEREALFTTPHNADLASLIRAAGVRHVRVDRASELPQAMREATGLSVIEVHVDPEGDRAVRAGVARSVAVAVERLLEV